MTPANNDNANANRAAVDYATAKAPTARMLRPSRGRPAILVTMIIALIAAGAFQRWAYALRSKAVHADRPVGAAPPSRLANLDSFSLALLLGGLRGPLVMFLWTSSESQKSEKDLESFDTQVELIRLLQPEFATVHLFQIWNKAYNISVQMASLANKYAAILDAIQYGERTDRSNPNDINIVMSIGSIYADKLGNSAEKDYYRKRLRTETLPVYRITMPAARADEFKKAASQVGLDPERIRLTSTPGAATVTATLEKLVGDRVQSLFSGPGIDYKPVPRQSLRPPSLGGRRTEMDTLLDASGNLLPQYIKPLFKVADPARQNNGAELQYLEQFQPFPYGISPIAMGYNYYKRAQVIQASGTQRHIQVSDLVVDAQPALGLEQWSKEEFERARRLEISGLAPAAGGPATATSDAQKQKPDLQTASLGPANAKVIDASNLREAIFSYGRTARIVEAALPEFQRHIETYPSNLQNYRSHSDELRALMHIAQADAAVLQAVLAKESPADRQKAIGQASNAYREAAKWYRLVILKYYTEDQDAKAIGYDRQSVENKSHQEIADFAGKLESLITTKYGHPDRTPHGHDRLEYLDRLTRIAARERLLTQP
jgi:hypothetical protein